MKQKDIIKKIREYHIIRDIVANPEVQDLQKTDISSLVETTPVDNLVAVFNAYVDFFGAIDIGGESFDEYFSRLKTNYDSKGKEIVKPSNLEYGKYIKKVLGSEGLDNVTEAFSVPDVAKEIRGLSLDVGKNTRESNAIVVVRALEAYSKVNGLKTQIEEAKSDSANLKDKLNQAEKLLAVKNASSLTEEQVIAKLTELEDKYKSSIEESAKESNYLSVAIAKSSGKKLNEILDTLKNFSNDSHKRDTEILSAIEQSDANNKKEFNEMKEMLNKKSTGKKIAAGVGIAALAGVAGFSMGLLVNNSQEPEPIPSNNDNKNDSAYVEFVNDYNGLHTSLNNYIADNVYNNSEKAQFESSVDKFAAKYEGTAYKDESQEKADFLKDMSANLAGMNGSDASLIEKAEYLKEYNQLRGEFNSIIEDKKVTDEEYSNFSGENGFAKNFASKYANTDYKDQSEQDSQILINYLDLLNDNADLSEQIAIVSAELETAKNTIKDLNQQKDELQAKYDVGVLTEKQLREEIARLEKSEAELGKQVAELTSDIADLNEQLAEKIAEYNELFDAYNDLNAENTTLRGQLTAAENTIKDLESQIASTTNEAAELIFDIYEYITGETTTDLAQAMQIVSEQLGITTIEPSTPDVENNVKQPEL